MHTAENIDAVNDLVLSMKSALATHKNTRQIARETHFVEVSGPWVASQRHSAKVPEETSRAGVNCVKQSAIDQAIDQWWDRLNVCVKAKHIEHLS